jgi:endonuclease-8
MDIALSWTGSPRSISWGDVPEGPEIRRAADEIESALLGERVERAYFRFPRLAPYASLVEGERVAAVRTWGKALLTQLANGLVIYSHNQLYGRWYVCAPDRPPQTDRELRLGLYTRDRAALLYSASEIELLDAGNLEAQPFLARLGPDVLWPDATPGLFRTRLEAARFARRQLGGLLLDQGFAAGVGNYLRAEILFVAGLHPKRRPVDCTAEELDRLADATCVLCRQAYKHAGVTNDLVDAKRLRQRGQRFEEYRFWVFARAGKPCRRCGARIQRSDVAGRRCYWCVRCQPP